MIDSFLEYLFLEKKYSINTISAYKTDLLAFKDFCETDFNVNNLSEVEYPIIRSWIVNLVHQKISNRSINRKITSLNSFYKFLQKTHQIEINPLSKHKSLKSVNKLQIPFSVKEINDAINSVSENSDFKLIRNKLIIELLYSTGVRKSELIHIKESDIDFGNKTVKVLGKRNKERFVPLLESVIAKIKQYQILRDEFSEGAEELLITENGNKLSKSLVYGVINSYFSNVSTKTKKSPHILRHSFATHLLNEGANLNSVKELLGHSSLASTQVYTHNSLEVIKKVYNQAHPRSLKK
ncbi:tyrosine-type recombinase/integrase [Polaribacter gangjinensis]|uniref:tyrosine-type recombinase/integrase n=1 Tax=Polaribacter gangjinensis TaxID=574710 RepID=UPI000CF4F5F3|nr:tyrosine-type recombinase/integrase [Polaribacter gangjinensis]